MMFVVFVGLAALSCCIVGVEVARGEEVARTKAGVDPDDPWHVELADRPKPGDPRGAGVFERKKEKSEPPTLPSVVGCRGCSS